MKINVYLSTQNEMYTSFLRNEDMKTRLLDGCKYYKFWIYTHPVNSKHIFRNSNIFLIPYHKLS